MNHSAKRIAIICSQFNQDITEALYKGALAQLLAQGVLEANIGSWQVPGAVEIPIVAQRLAKTLNYDAIITLGAVIRGDTTHYDYVCQQVSQGCQQVALSTDTPVIFGILTTENEAQAWERLGGVHGHKGVDAANTALAIWEVLRAITQPSDR